MKTENNLSFGVSLEMRRNKKRIKIHLMNISTIHYTYTLDMMRTHNFVATSRQWCTSLFQRFQNYICHTITILYDNFSFPIRESTYYYDVYIHNGVHAQLCRLTGGWRGGGDPHIIYDMYSRNYYENIIRIIRDRDCHTRTRYRSGENCRST